METTSGDLSGAARLRISGGDGELAVQGELDAYSAPQLQEALDAEDASAVRLNLAEVSFIDSTGIRVLLTVDRRLVEAGGRLVIVEPSPAVWRLLELTALESHLEVEREAAG